MTIYILSMSCVGMGLNNLDDSKDGIEKFLNRNPDKYVKMFLLGVL